MADQPKPNVLPDGIEELNYLRQLYKMQYDALNEEIDAVMGAIRNIGATQTTLENMDLVSSRSLMIPVGQETFVEGKADGSNTVIIGVGGNVYLEKSVDDAKKQVSKGLDSTNQYLASLTKRRKDVEAALIEVSYKIEEVTRKV